MRVRYKPRVMDWKYLVFFFIPMGFGLLVQFRLRSQVNRWMKVAAKSGTTGTEAAETILRANEIGQKVDVKYAQGGPLSDHYNPKDKTVNLSKPVADKTSIASNAIAAHECGHALQDEYGGGFYKVRSWMWPIVSLASMAWFFLLLGGMLLDITGLVTVAIVLYAATILFQVVTLPVEFNASFGEDKALDQLQRNGLLTPDEIDGAREVLRAAAMTYVAGALAAVSQFAFFLLQKHEADQAREQREEARAARQSDRPSQAAAGGGAQRRATRSLTGQLVGPR